MKYLFAVMALALASFNAQAECDAQGFAAVGPGCQVNGQDQQQQQLQGQLQGQAQGQAQIAGAIQGQAQDHDNDQNIVIRSKYDAVANSASELNLAYCADGASGQDSSAGFSIGQVNYVCEAMASLKVSLLLVEMELNTADRLWESTPENAEMHQNRAFRHMTDSETIMADVVSYIQGRRDTAGLSATAKDLTWPVGLITLLFFLL